MAASSEQKITFGGCALLSSYQLSYSCKWMISHSSCDDTAEC